MIDPSILSLVSAAIETAANKALSYDPGTKAQLAQLNGKKLAIHIQDLKLTATVAISEGLFIIGIAQSDTSISQHSSAEATNASTAADVSLYGSWSDLAKLTSSEHKSLANTGVEAYGNLSVLEAFQEALSELDIDWRDALEQKLGALLSAPIIASIDAGMPIIKTTLHSAKGQAEHFVINELQLVPQQSEFSPFIQEVNDLRMRSDRLIAQFNQYISRPNTK